VGSLIVIAVLFALFWVVLLRPQRRRAAVQRALLDSLEPGDEIISTGGMFGVIRSIDDDELRVEVSDGVVVRMARRAVAGIVEHDEEPESDPELERSEDPSDDDSGQIDPVESRSEPAKPS
jgi:preprotein translocase subunit YajC